MFIGVAFQSGELVRFPIKKLAGFNCIVHMCSKGHAESFTSGSIEIAATALVFLLLKLPAHVFFVKVKEFISCYLPNVQSPSCDYDFAHLKVSCDRLHVCTLTPYIIKGFFWNQKLRSNFIAQQFNWDVRRL